jgi:hypothetical protein
MKGQTIRSMISAVPGAVLRMSRSPVNYWAEFGLDIPLGVMLILEGLRRHDIHSIEVFLTILLGLYIFSYLEYSVHRWLFHGSVRIISQGHNVHHKNPQAYDALPFFLPSLVILGLTGVFVLLMPASYAFLLSGVMAFGYVTYGLSHFTIFANLWPDVGRPTISSITTTPKATLVLPRRCGTYYSARGMLFRITTGFRHGPS